MFSNAIRNQGNFDGLGVSVWRQTRVAAAALLAVLALSSCAVSPIGDGDAGAASSPEARRAAVQSRVQARWDALIKGDLEKSYSYLSPASRSTLTFEQYKGVTRKSGFRNARIDSIDCDAQACTVKLLVTYDHKLMRGIQTPVEETWVFDKGQAWYVYRG